MNNFAIGLRLAVSALDERCPLENVKQIKCLRRQTVSSSPGVRRAPANISAYTRVILKNVLAAANKGRKKEEKGSFMNVYTRDETISAKAYKKVIFNESVE